VLRGSYALIAAFGAACDLLGLSKATDDDPYVAELVPSQVTIEVGQRVRMMGWLQSPLTLRALRDNVASRATRAWDPTPQGEVTKISSTCLAGMLSVALGDSATLLRNAATLGTLRPSSGFGHPTVYLGTSLRAHMHRRAGRRTEALEMLEQAPRPDWFGDLVAMPAYTRHHERYARAELLLEMGRLREALAWYSTFAEHSVYDLPYLAPSHFRRAEIHERLGERAQAITHYERFVELWRDCDPELRPRVSDGERRLATLREARS
jgi:tetratricopeptide (TPR) repeat protein